MRCTQELYLWYSCTEWSYSWFSDSFCILVFFLPQKLRQKLLNEKCLNWIWWLYSFLQSNINFLIIKKHHTDRSRKTRMFLFHVLELIWFIVIGESRSCTRKRHVSNSTFFPLSSVVVVVTNLSLYIFILLTVWLLTSAIPGKNAEARNFKSRWEPGDLHLSLSGGIPPCWGATDPVIWGRRGSSNQFTTANFPQISVRKIIVVCLLPWWIIVNYQVNYQVW